MADRDKVLAALQKMDPNNDNHWTISGEAKLETIKFLSGGETVTRDELVEIAPDFNREAMKAYIASNQQGDGNAGSPPTPPATGPGIGNGSGDQAEQLKVADAGSEDRETEIEALAKEIAGTQEAILEYQRISEEMKAKMMAAEAHRQTLEARMQKISPEVPHMANIKLYLASSKKAMQARGHARKVVVSSGVDLGALNQALQPAPIDAAMQGRRRPPMR